jgi:hypothetical protein
MLRTFFGVMPVTTALTKRCEVRAVSWSAVVRRVVIEVGDSQNNINAIFVARVIPKLIHTSTFLALITRAFEDFGAYFFPIART